MSISFSRRHGDANPAVVLVHLLLNDKYITNTNCMNPKKTAKIVFVKPPAAMGLKKVMILIFNC